MWFLPLKNFSVIRKEIHEQIMSSNVVYALMEIHIEPKGPGISLGVGGGDAGENTAR